LISIINTAYSFYLKANIKILTVLNGAVVVTAAGLTKAKIKLEVRVHKFATHRDALKGKTSEQKREIPETWFYCSNCGAAADSHVEYCPTGCGFSPLKETRLTMPQIKALLEAKKIWTTRPGLYLQNKKPPVN